ncbi:hypothetical protein [Demequina sediminicola]|uniref:hypothetical protein n=1 Tax=Demequina sediminicola TaxID=1095026 RepID=UPI00078424A7|nr:hypothetical protein [Demequina sediminicola]
MTFGGLAAIVVFVCVAWGSRRARQRHGKRALGWPWAAAAVLVLGPIVYTGYTPLATIEFEAAGFWGAAAMWVAFLATWLWMMLASLNASDMGGHVANAARIVLALCGQVWIIILVTTTREESGATPELLDSAAYVTHWMTAVLAVASIVTLACAPGYRSPLLAAQAAADAGR